MKVLIATGLYPPESGGPATFARMAEVELDKRGWQIVVCPFSRVRRFPVGVRHALYLYQLLRVRKIDLVLALDPVSVGVPARIVAFLKRVPFVVRLGGDYAWEQGRQRFGVSCTLDDFSKKRKLKLPVRGLQWIQATVVQSADRVIAPSEYLQSIIATWGVDKHNIEVIYSVSYLEAPDEAHTQTRRVKELQLSTHTPVILSISRLVPWKGFAALLKVVEVLKKDWPHVLLLIGGDGPEYEALHKAIQAKKLQAQVRLLGRVDRREMESLSKEVAMFVLNTEYEGFSHLLVEHMQLGVPIITTNVGGNSELIEQNKTGLLVTYNAVEEIAEAITILTTEHGVRERLIHNAKERVKKITVAESVGRLESIMREVIEKQT